MLHLSINALPLYLFRLACLPTHLPQPSTQPHFSFTKPASPSHDLVKERTSTSSHHTIYLHQARKYRQ
jgi:hypothetical protein